MRIHRAHLEEDAAKMIHVGESGRIHGSGASLVDFNRGGTPLVEIVTEPDLRSAAEAAAWARLLRETVRQLGVSDVNMEEGSLRVDANVSVRPAGSEELGTKTELKNMNSFRFLERGVEAELARQRGLIESGGGSSRRPSTSTPATGRSPRCARRRRRTTIATSPSPTWCRWRRPRRWCGRRGSRCPSCQRRGSSATSAIGLATETAGLLAADPETAAYFERVDVAAEAEPKVVANWVTGELAAALRQDGGGGERRRIQGRARRARRR